MLQHGVRKRDLIEPPPPYTHNPDESRTYRISFPQAACDIACPVGWCMGRATIWSDLWFHLGQHHMQYMLVVLEEGNHPLLCCLKYDIFVPWRALNRNHKATAMCDKEGRRNSSGQGKRRRRKARWCPSSPTGYF